MPPTWLPSNNKASAKCELGQAYQNTPIFQVLSPLQQLPSQVLLAIKLPKSATTPLNYRSQLPDPQGYLLTGHPNFESYHPLHDQWHPNHHHDVDLPLGEAASQYLQFLLLDQGQDNPTKDDRQDCQPQHLLHVKEYPCPEAIHL
jgi:hypothetical protein